MQPYAPDQFPYREVETLRITGFLGEKKAEQPLPIYGDWEYKFTVE